MWERMRSAPDGIGERMVFHSWVGHTHSTMRRLIDVFYRLFLDVRIGSVGGAECKVLLRLFMTSSRRQVLHVNRTAILELVLVQMWSFLDIPSTSTSSLFFPPPMQVSRLSA